MLKIFQLSKHNLDLSKEEVLALVKSKEYDLFDNILIVKDNSNLKLENRLGYTHKIYKFLFKCKTKDFIEKIKEYDWQSIYKKNFCVRIHDSDLIEKEIASLIWHNLKNPKVNLENPHTKIEFFFHKDIVVAGLFENNIDKTFLKRKAHLRPSLHPTSMHPGLARAIINLTGLKKGTILDPFCGSGGILIEAGLMGFNVIGYDIDKKQLERAKKNLEYYKINDYKLINKDALLIKEKADAIVTDLPYGIGSKVKNAEKLYKDFLKNSKKISKNRIIIFPDFIDIKIKPKKVFSEYIHKSLTRKIIVL